MRYLLYHTTDKTIIFKMLSKGNGHSFEYITKNNVSKIKNSFSQKKINPIFSDIKVTDQNM